MKNQSGISVIVLVIAIVVLIIVTITIIISNNNTVKTKSLNNMYADIKSLNDSVFMYYSKYGVLPIKEKFEGNYDFTINKNPNDAEDGYYIIDISKLTSLILTRNLTWTGDDVYIVNDKTHTIYYPKGIIYEGDKYYTLPK
ncbi:MAG: hypothetical protein IJ223_05980 [Clostridia bacterium]|nr:hypothetical protein [Clostridia bacterium]